MIRWCHLTPPAGAIFEWRDAARRFVRLPIMRAPHASHSHGSTRVCRQHEGLPLPTLRNARPSVSRTRQRRRRRGVACSIRCLNAAFTALDDNGVVGTEWGGVRARIYGRAPLFIAADFRCGPGRGPIGGKGPPGPRARDLGRVRFLDAAIWHMFAIRACHAAVIGRRSLLDRSRCGKFCARLTRAVADPYSAAASRMSGSASMTVTPHGEHRNVRCVGPLPFFLERRIGPPQLGQCGGSGSNMSAIGRQVRPKLFRTGKAARRWNV